MHHRRMAGKVLVNRLIHIDFTRFFTLSVSSKGAGKMVEPYLITDTPGYSPV